MLKRELERWQKRAEAQRNEIVKQRGKINRLRDGNREIDRAVNAIMIEFAKKFGAEVGIGIFEMTIPEPNVASVNQYTVRTTKNQEALTYTVRVERVPEKDNT